MLSDVCLESTCSQKPHSSQLSLCGCHCDCYREINMQMQNADEHEGEDILSTSAAASFSLDSKAPLAGRYLYRFYRRCDRAIRSLFLSTSISPIHTPHHCKLQSAVFYSRASSQSRNCTVSTFQQFSDTQSQGLMALKKLCA